jgi:hypothetical protein
MPWLNGRKRSAGSAKYFEKLRRNGSFSFSDGRQGVWVPTLEEFPWGERVVKVKKKIFVFLGKGDRGFGLSAKLPQSQDAALMLPFAEPTAYGLGKFSSY